MEDVTDKTDFQAIVVGTGFAGAVTACRLVEAGFDICVLERGRRYGRDDFPRYPTEELFADADGPQRQFAPPPDFSRWLWASDHGLYDVRDLGDVTAVQAAGYGGGSLIYANVHLRPPYEVFKTDWPNDYTEQTLSPYFDLAAYMLGARPIPQRLAKTLQLKRAEKGPGSWFRTPLAVKFDEVKVGEAPLNRDGREQHACDMRGRCWRGCDRQAKNTLDLNYLARAEDGGCDIRTLAEVTRIGRTRNRLVVHYNDLLHRGRVDNVEEDSKASPRYVTARHVFLCAGAVNTTELLLKSEQRRSKRKKRAVLCALGSRYFPNSDSLAVVFDCDEPHEADYGPTITSAMLYDRESDDDFSCTLEFKNGVGPAPKAGMQVKSSSDGTATLSHDPILDWGEWKANAGKNPLCHDPILDAGERKESAVGVVALTNISTSGTFNSNDTLTFRFPTGEDGAAAVTTARAQSSLIKRRQWFLVEDGGYSPDVEPLVGIFRSPLWIRRNRYLEEPATSSERAKHDASPRQTTPLRRPPAGRLQLDIFADALGATSRHAFAAEGVLPRTFDPHRGAADSFSGSKNRELLFPGLLQEQVSTVFPSWFVKALAQDRQALLEQAAAFALPVLGRLFDELSQSVAQQIDPETRARFSKNRVDDEQLEVLTRGLLRQVVQILAGSEAAIATRAAQVFLKPLPGTPQQLVSLLANVLLWAIGYNTTVGHTAVLLTMGRDAYRGRLELKGSALKATVPTRVLDSVSATHERVLREIAIAWRGELRTNPGWTTLGKRITVHNQGGCPMGPEQTAVTDPDGKVYGWDGLYVMDAAAFPTSVGVNPSATITAIAEYKIERFIQQQKRESTRLARDHAAAQEWMQKHGRAVLDPLNAGTLTSRCPPSKKIDVLGLSFKEEMHGFAAPLTTETRAVLASITNLRTANAVEQVRRSVNSCLERESEGIRSFNPVWRLELHVRADDLARLVAAEAGASPTRMTVSGRLALTFPTVCKIYPVDSANSFLQMFVRAGRNDTKFFHYHLHFGDDGEYRLDGLKVLHNAPGFDAWHDTSTVYFDTTGPGDPQRGVLRVSAETFLRVQLPSMEITGTTDPARQSWALLAFYKYFGGELSEIYLERADAWKEALFKLLTAIHV